MAEKKLTQKKIFHPDEKLTSEDIDACNDIPTLLKWKIYIEGKIMEAQIRIDDAKAEANAESNFMDREKWSKLNSYRRVIGYLSQKIQYRLREIKHERQSTDINHLFVRIAKTVLDKETFDKIYEEAVELKSKQI